MDTRVSVNAYVIVLHVSRVFFKGSETEVTYTPISYLAFFV